MLELNLQSEYGRTVRTGGPKSLRQADFAREASILSRCKRRDVLGSFLNFFILVKAQISGKVTAGKANVQSTSRVNPAFEGMTLWRRQTALTYVHADRLLARR